nr:hypothetical protein [Tanacetum cinerariifolium]
MKDVPVIVLSDDESESDEDFTIRFKRSDTHKPPSIPKTLIDESTNDDVANSMDVKIGLLSKNTTFVTNEVHIVSYNDENDVPVIVLSDDESDVPVSSKHRRLSKNSIFVNNNEESDEDFTIRFKRSDTHKLPSIPKTLIDMLCKNTTFVNNEVHIVSSNDENVLLMANNLEILKETDNM